MADPYGDPYSTPYLPPPSYPTNNNGSSMNKETGGYYGGEAPRNGPGPDRFAPRQGGHREGGGRGGRDQDRGRRRQNGPPEDNRNNGRHGHPYGTSGRHSGGGDGGWRPRGGSNGGADVGWGKRASQAGPIGFDHPHHPQPEGSAPFQDRRGGDARAQIDQSTMDERAQKEKPCRTLFVRNVNYEANADELKDRFASFGDVKTMYDKINDRGMLFVTYFDLKVAETAKEAMHGFRVGTRDIDVHYSLPREQETQGQCDRDKNQGTLMLRLQSGRNILSDQIRRVFSEFGEIKSIRNAGSPDRKILEYFDSRGAALALDSMQNQPFQDSVLDLQFIWDDPPSKHGRGPGAGPAVRGRRDGRGGAGHSGEDQRRDPGRRFFDDRAGSPDRTYGRGPAVGGPPVPSFKLDDAKKVQDLLASLASGGVVSSSAPPPKPYIPPGGMPPPILNFEQRPPPGNMDYSRPPPPTYPPVPPVNQYGPPSVPINPFPPPPVSTYGQESQNAPYPPSNMSYPPTRQAPSPDILPPGSYNPHFSSSSAPPNPYGGPSPASAALPPSYARPAAPGLPPNVVAMLQTQQQNRQPPTNLYTSTSAQYPPTTPPPSFGSSSVPQAPAGQTHSQTGEQTQAMTQLLALLVNQQQKR